ncbi:MAG: hypothetical protein FWC95_00165 [Defluviitaleaceae bacterium]|nr:hypothetical protein [Defluviitaleaceae bacterium]
MAKAKRGKTNLTVKGWRGSCPQCSRTGVRLLWETKGEDDKNIKICKVCDAAIRNKAS